MNRRRLAIALGLVLALARFARAADGRAIDQPLVILTLAGRQDAEDAAFFSSMRALAAEIGIGVSAHEVESFTAVRDTLLAEARKASKPFLVAWILRQEGTRELHLFDPWKNQLRTRTVAVGASATANAETLALILRAELLAYLSEPPPAPPVAPPPPAPTPTREPSFSLGLSWLAGTFLRGQDVQQGARLGLGHRWSRVRVAMHYGFLPGQEVRAEDVTLTVRRHPFDLELGYASAPCRLCVLASVFVSGDLVSRHTSFAVEPLSAQPDDTHFVVGAGLRAALELRLLRNLAVHLGLASEAPFNPYDFQIVRGTTATSLTRLAPVRVSGELGVDILGF